MATADAGRRNASRDKRRTQVLTKFNQLTLAISFEKACSKRRGI